MNAARGNPHETAKRPVRAARRLVWALGVVFLFYLALLIPEAKFVPPEGAGQRPFAWSQDRFWSELEQEFVMARQDDPRSLSNRLALRFTEARQALEDLKQAALPPGHAAFGVVENTLFRLAPLVGASPERIPELAALVGTARSLTKKQSEAWDLQDPKAREQLYRILFGGRMALEQVMIQHPESPAVAAALHEEPSVLPVVTVDGVALRSGDILLSRGNAPTSSLIARGNDYPGNFSHAALLHVDEQTGEASVIESLIECGVTRTPLSTFIAEERLRLMALRLRADLPAMRTDPHLPHRAATRSLKAAAQGHTAYDFAMNFADPRAQFCSEVVSSAFGQAGVRLWMGMSYISSPTVTAWLGSLGVRHFVTQEPSDLEYDSQLRVVAEWRYGTNLFQAHLDDAVTESMLEAATPGAPLDYSLWKLPLARIAKAYSAVLVALGKTGPVPEGMSATTALRVSRFKTEHRLLKERLARRAQGFQVRNGYAPPYWELLKMASPEPNPGNPPAAGGGVGGG